MAFLKKEVIEKEKANSESEHKKGSNPYLNGREEWLERYGSYIAQATNWRRISFFALAITTLSITGNVIQASRVVPTSTESRPVNIGVKYIIKAE